MKSHTLLAALPAALTVSATKCKPYVDSQSLQDLIKLEDLLAGSQKLQDFADANDGNRAFGSGGHNATVDWLYDTLVATGYYDVYKQPFVELYSEGAATVSVDGTEIETQLMTYSPGNVAEGVKLVLAANVGCDAADYPPEAEGNVVLILRGTCSFAAKALAAGAAGAAGAIVYNSEPGIVAGTLGETSDDYAAIVGITQDEGVALAARLEAGEDLTVDFDVLSIIEDRVNYNVIAETKGGDHDNVLILGGHSDSVAAGPGINDDGSGSIGVLTTALALTGFSVKNAVRFAFWGAEEFGKLGSYYYVKQLNTSDIELAKMRAYLNFDMIASPNYMYGIYDGDGSAFNFSGPPGSAAIEREFELFYERNGAASVPTEFTYRSDYAAFIENGIPSGGIFTGAEGVKTEAEAALFGGEAGVAYDVNYHEAGDTIENLAHDAFLLNTKSIAHTVALYSMSFESIEPVDLHKRRWAADRALVFNRRDAEVGHSHGHAGPCGGPGARR